MALWKEVAPTPAPGAAPAAAPAAATNARPPAETAPRPSFDRAAVEPAAAPARPAVRAEMKESLIASGLAIEGKISGTGHVRIAGQFKGDVKVEGNLSIE